MRSAGFEGRPDHPARQKNALGFQKIVSALFSTSPPNQTPMTHRLQTKNFRVSGGHPKSVSFCRKCSNRPPGGSQGVKLDGLSGVGATRILGFERVRVLARSPPGVSGRKVREVWRPFFLFHYSLVFVCLFHRFSFFFVWAARVSAPGQRPLAATCPKPAHAQTPKFG